LEILSKKSGLRIPKALAELRNKEIRYDIKCKKDEMKDVISKMLNI